MAGLPAPEGHLPGLNVQKLSPSGFNHQTQPVIFDGIAHNIPALILGAKYAPYKSRQGSLSYSAGAKPPPGIPALTYTTDLTGMQEGIPLHPRRKMELKQGIFPAAHG